jgi:hypothetical protein
MFSGERTTNKDGGTVTKGGHMAETKHQQLDRIRSDCAKTRDELAAAEEGFKVAGKALEDARVAAILTPAPDSKAKVVAAEKRLAEAGALRDRLADQVEILERIHEKLHVDVSAIDAGVRAEAREAAEAALEARLLAGRPAAVHWAIDAVCLLMRSGVRVTDVGQALTSALTRDPCGPTAESAIYAAAAARSRDIDLGKAVLP